MVFFLRHHVLGTLVSSNRNQLRKAACSSRATSSKAPVTGERLVGPSIASENTQVNKSAYRVAVIVPSSLYYLRRFN
jgi:hypothetical protein